MTLEFHFHNRGSNPEFCRVSLKPSSGDEGYAFNMLVRRKGDSTQILAAPNFLQGIQAELTVEAQPDQSVTVLIEGPDSFQKSMEIKLKDEWLYTGDVAISQSIVHYL